MFAGKEGAECGGRTRRGRGEGRASGERAGTHFRRETDPHTHTQGSRARHPQGGGARQWVAPSLPPLSLTRKWCCSSCSREPRFLHAPSLPSLPPLTQS